MRRISEAKLEAAVVGPDGADAISDRDSVYLMAEELLRLRALVDRIKPAKVWRVFNGMTADTACHVIVVAPTEAEAIQLASDKFEGRCGSSGFEAEEIIDLGIKGTPSVEDHIFE